MLTREECLEIFELEESAERRDIENKYTMLVKKYRSIDSDEAREKLDKVSLAYNILTGRYVEPEPINPRLEKVVAGKSIKQWQTVWHYGRWPLLAITIIAVLAISLIHSIATNKRADFAVIVMGQFYDGGSAYDSSYAYFSEISAGKVENPDIHIIPIDLRADNMFDMEEIDGETVASDSVTPEETQPLNIDPQSQYAFNMKLVTLLYSDKIDIFMSTDAAFHKYAPQGVFVDLSELYESLADLPADVYAKIKPMYASIENVEPGEEETVSYGDPILLGIDVSELAVFEGLDIWIGDDQIISVGIKTRDEAVTLSIISEWIRDYVAMEAKADELASANPSMPEGAWAK